MSWRGEAGAGFAAGAALLVVVSVSGFPDFFGTLVGSGAETRFFDFACFEDFLPDVLAAFFATGFFAGFMAAFLACLTTRLLFLTRFFDAAALVVRARGDLRTFFAFLPDGFFLGVATTNSFMAQTELLGLISAERYRVASASSPNTEKTSGFRSRLYSAVSRAARLIFSHTSASRARRGRLALALASSLRRRSLPQRSTLSMKAPSATRSLPPSASPSAWSSRGSTRGRVASSAAVRC